MVTIIGQKIMEKAAELSVSALIAIVAWGIWTTVDISALKAHAATTASTIRENTGKIDATQVEQRVTNERLTGTNKRLDEVITELRLLRQELSRH